MQDILNIYMLIYTCIFTTKSRLVFFKIIEHFQQNLRGLNMETL